MNSLTRRSVLMTGAAAFALGGSNLETYAQQPKKGGTLNFAISAETPHYDNHGSDTYATLHFAAPFYSTLLRFNLSKFPEIEGDLADSWQVAPDLSDRRRQRVRGTQLGVAHGANQEQGAAMRAGREAAQQQQRRRLGPVEVVEHEDHRLLGRERLEQGAHRAVRAIALILEAGRCLQPQRGEPGKDICELRHLLVLEGREAARFGAATSGQTFLYDARGGLLFSGGITGARAHAGDNAGRSAVVTLLNGTGGPAAPRTSVFGCPLFDRGERQSF